MHALCNTPDIWGPSRGRSEGGILGLTSVSCSVNGSADDEGMYYKIEVCGHSMRIGVSCILAILPHKILPKPGASLRGATLFDPYTLTWTKSSSTTVVYGDDIGHDYLSR